jgi:hypothetical protein
MAMCGCCGCCVLRRSLSRPRARTTQPSLVWKPSVPIASPISPRFCYVIRIHVKWLAHDSLRALLKVRRPAVSRRLADGNRKSAAGGRWRPRCYMVNSGPNGSRPEDLLSVTTATANQQQRRRLVTAMIDDAYSNNSLSVSRVCPERSRGPTEST